MPDKKNNQSKKSGKKNAPKAGQPGPLEALGKLLDGTKPIHAAEEAVVRAREEFDNAVTQYREARDATRSRIQSLKDKNARDVVDEVLDQASKRPGWAIGISLAVGFLLARKISK